MKTSWIVLASWLAVACVAAGAGEGHVLARDGKTHYVVVRAKDADKAEAVAAKELAKYLTQVTGTSFAVVAEGAARKDGPALFVGPTQQAAKCGIDTSKLGREEWVIRSVGDDLVLAGGRPRGTLYAVYEFLEEHVGCHWLDWRTEVVPSRRVLTVPRLAVRAKPAFWHRHIYTAAHHTWGGGGGWFRLRNKSSHGLPVAAYPHSGRPGACHTFYAYSKDWPKDHPEYFSMNAHGKRERATSGSGPGHFCLTHPMVPKLVLERLRRFIAQDRARAAEKGHAPPRVYDISQNDNNNYVCLCPTCKKLIEREGSASGLMIHFINQVADGIRADYPDVLVQTFAYTSTQQPPKTLRPRDNVLIRLCDLGGEFGCGNAEHFKPLSHPFNKLFTERIKGWAAIAPHLAIWDYWKIYRQPFPNPYVNVSFLKPDVELFLDHNAETAFVECESVETTSFFALKRWLGYKLLQNPRRPAEPLIGAFMAGYYGPAASHMWAYLSYMENRIAAVSIPMAGLKPSERPYLDLAFFVTVERLFDQAEAACAPDSPALRHVHRERIPVDSALANLWAHLARQLPKGQAMPFDRQAVVQRYRAYRLAHMQARRHKSKLEAGKRELDDEVRKLSERDFIYKLKSQPPPSLSVPRIAPVADGDPTKADWARARDVGKWRANPGHSTPRKVSARVAHDGSRLYIQLAEDCDTAKLVADPSIWAGDDWEVFFAPARGKPPYRQLAVNPKGQLLAYHWTRRIGKLPPKLWDSGARAISDVKPRRWTVRLSIPLADLIPGGVRPGQPFFANLYRASSNARNTLAWSPNFDRNFHILTRLARLTLE